MSLTMAQDATRRNLSEMERALRTAKEWSRVRGQSATCPNPKHEDRDPSGWIKVGDDGIVRFSCQSCKFHGDVFDVMAITQNRSVAEIMTDIREKDTNHATPAEKRQRALPDLDAVRAALPGRVVLEHSYPRVNGELTMMMFRCEPDGKSKEYRPAIPWGDGWALKAPPRPYPLYGLPAIVAAETIVVVEGEKCCDRLAEYGICATTSPFGASSAGQADWTVLARKRVVIWPDPDEAGRGHCANVQAILSKIRPQPHISVIDPADLGLTGKEDAYDFIEQLKILGKSDEDIRKELRLAISGARSIGPLDSYRKRQAAIARGEIRCVAWVFPQLTKRTRALQPKRVAVVAGKKGSTKSFFAEQNQMFLLDRGESAAVMTLEGSIDDYLDRALALLDANANLTDLDWVRDNFDEAQAAIDRHADALAQLKASVTRASINITLEQVADWIDQQAKQGRRVITIDPVSAAVRTGKPWVADQAFLNRVRVTAEEHGCSVVLVTHLQKGATEFSSDALAGSACYERFSDTIIQLHRHDIKTSLVKTDPGRAEFEHNLTLFIEKARAPGSGLKLAYNFDPKTLRLKEHGIILKKAKD